MAAFEVFASSEAYRRFLGPDHPGPSELVSNNLGVDGAWVIALAGAVVGSVFLGTELACLLDPSVHGRGIGAEAAQAVIGDGFRRRDYPEVIAHTDPRNVASIRALARLGFEALPDDVYRLRRSAWTAHNE